MGTRPFQELRVYQAAEGLADEVWRVARTWDSFARDTPGKQIVRAADSIGANIAEGTGRGSFADNRRFIRIARGSYLETRHWLRRAYRRGLLRTEQAETLRAQLDDVGRLLNAYLRSIGSIAPGVTDSTIPPPDDDRGASSDSGPRTKDQ